MLHFSACTETILSHVKTGTCKGMFLCALFCIILYINNGYFHKQRQLVGRLNADCFPCKGGSEFLICIPY